MAATPAQDSPAVANRREQLRAWIREHHQGKQAAFLTAIADGNRGEGINQGLLSGLLNRKSFGEKIARKLEQMAGMPPGYLDHPPGQAAPTPAPRRRSTATPPWPFSKVTPGDLASLSPDQLRTVEAVILSMLDSARAQQVRRRRAPAPA